MTNGPQLRLGSALLPGILAVALFAIIALVVINTPFNGMEGFPEGISVTSEIGYAMLDLTPLQSTEGSMGATEPFLISFFLAAIVLDAALDASIVLAKREEGGESVSAYATTSSSSDDETAVTDGGEDTDPSSSGRGGDGS